MPEPTYSRQTLRRLLARDLGMEYNRRTGKDYGQLTSASSGTSMADSALAQQTDFWAGSSLLVVKSDATVNCRLIKNFTTAGGIFTLDTSLGYTPATNDVYEVHSGWDGVDLNNAINRAIEDAFPAFYDFTSDSSIVIQEDKTTYSLSSLTPHVLLAAYVEQPKNVIRGVVSANNGGTTLTDSSANWTTNEHAGKLVSIYASAQGGTALGTSTTVVSNTATTLTVTFSGTLKIGDLYALWNPSSEITNWRRLIAGRTDARTWPSALYLTQVYSQHLGMRLMLEYTKRPVSMTLETDTTMVPQEFILNRAAALLYEQRMNDGRYDRARFGDLANRKAQMAEQYRITRAWPLPPTTFWQEQEQSYPFLSPDGDPLDWAR